MSINTVVVSGNLARDPELKQLGGGTSILDFSIAVSERWHDKAANEWKERTHWIGVVAWAALAERMSKRLAKGDAVLVHGSLTQESWDDKETRKKREKTKVTAREIEKIEKAPRRDGGQSEARQPEGGTPKLPEVEDGDSIPF